MYEQLYKFSNSIDFRLRILTFFENLQDVLFSQSITQLQRQIWHLPQIYVKKHFNCYFQVHSYTNESKNKRRVLLQQILPSMAETVKTCSYIFIHKSNSIHQIKVVSHIQRKRSCVHQHVDKSQVPLLYRVSNLVHLRVFFCFILAKCSLMPRWSEPYSRLTVKY